MGWNVVGDRNGRLHTFLKTFLKGEPKMTYLHLKYFSKTEPLIGGYSTPSETIILEREDIQTIDLSPEGNVFLVTKGGKTYFLDDEDEKTKELIKEFRNEK
jgi:hypothetical protein